MRSFVRRPIRAVPATVSVARRATGRTEAHHRRSLHRSGGEQLVGVLLARPARRAGPTACATARPAGRCRRGRGRARRCRRRRPPSPARPADRRRRRPGAGGSRRAPAARRPAPPAPGRRREPQRRRRRRRPRRTRSCPPRRRARGGGRARRGRAPRPTPRVPAAPAGSPGLAASTKVTSSHGSGPATSTAKRAAGHGEVGEARLDGGLQRRRPRHAGPPPRRAASRSTSASAAALASSVSATRSSWRSSSLEPAAHLVAVGHEVGERRAAGAVAEVAAAQLGQLLSAGLHRGEALGVGLDHLAQGAQVGGDVVQVDGDGVEPRRSVGQRRPAGERGEAGGEPFPCAAVGADGGEGGGDGVEMTLGVAEQVLLGGEAVVLARRRRCRRRRARRAGGAGTPPPARGWRRRHRGPASVASAALHPVRASRSGPRSTAGEAVQRVALRGRACSRATWPCWACSSSMPRPCRPGPTPSPGGRRGTPANVRCGARPG